MHEVGDPIALFQAWLERAWETEKINANAMTLATVSADGQPSARLVLLKEADARGFVFYTNLESQKARELAGNPAAALCFYWRTQGRQVRVEGRTEQVSDAEADAYFESRPRESRIGTWASDQSRRLADRAELEQAFESSLARFGEGPVPRPVHWSGYRLVPARIEFWEERPHRLHDRLVFERSGSDWATHRLYP